MDLETLAQELAETWLYGNMTDCIEALLHNDVEEETHAKVALLAILVYEKLIMPQDRKAFKRLLEVRI